MINYFFHFHLDKHKKKLSSLSVRGRALPPTPEPIQEEAESPYVSIHQVPDMTSLSIGTTALPIAGDTPSVCLEDQRLDDGYVQPLLFHQSDLAKKTASLQMLLAESSSSSDDEDSIYEEISTGALKHISHGMLKSYSVNRIYYTRNVLLSAQMGERASVVLICIITSRYNGKIVLPFPFSFSVSLSSISMSLSSRAHFSSALFVIFV